MVRVGDPAHVVDPCGEVAGAEGADPEGHAAPDRRAQRLGLGHLEAEAETGRVDDRGQHRSHLHELAGVDGPGVDHAGHLRAHLGAREVLPGDPEGGLRDLDRGGEAGAVGARAVQLLDGEEVVLGQGLAALQVGPGPVLLGPGLLEGGLRAFRLQPVAIRVDPQEHRARSHPVALAEAHVGRDALHLGRDLDHVLRLDLAEGLDLVDDVLDGDGRDPDPEGRPLRSARRGVAASPTGRPERGRHDGEDE